LQVYLLEVARLYDPGHVGDWLAAYDALAKTDEAATGSRPTGDDGADDEGGDVDLRDAVLAEPGPARRRRHLALVGIAGVAAIAGAVSLAIRFERIPGGGD
jgi:hypothetical protein